ncbi:MAG: AgmX/PglI C-terminal domain-containing protein, partial [Myxococcota bacterium]|nr:AgmX/PglI C-terminal domain-containing protein [Myxococcota bacterium]
DADAMRCAATSDRHCKRSAACRKEGRCVVVGGVCFPPCQHRPACLHEGRCTGHPQEVELDERRFTALRCEGGKDSDCRGSTACKTEGLCAWSEEAHECIATRARDCARSAGCTCEGRCELEAGACHGALPEDAAYTARRAQSCDQMCADSRACVEQGLCHYAPDDESCVAKSRADCVTPCEQVGACVFVSEAVGCVACAQHEEDPCADTLACRYEGACVHLPHESLCARPPPRSRKSRWTNIHAFDSDRRARPSCEALMEPRESTRILLTGLVVGPDGTRTPYGIQEHRTRSRSTSPSEDDSGLSSIVVGPCHQARDGTCSSDVDVPEGWFIGDVDTPRHWECIPHYEGPTLAAGVDGDRNLVCLALAAYVRKACSKGYGKSFAAPWCSQPPPPNTFRDRSRSPKHKGELDERSAEPTGKHDVNALLSALSKAKSSGESTSDADALPQRLSALAVRRTLRTKAGAFSACYKKMTDRPTHGVTVKVAIVVAGTGRVTSVRITSGGGASAHVLRCISSTLKRLKFPRFTQDEMRVNVPIVLR